jgi:hypothetical protein
VEVAGIRVLVGTSVEVAVGESVLVEVGNSTGTALTGAHALMMSAITRNEINLKLKYLDMSLTAAQDTLPH